MGVYPGIFAGIKMPARGGLDMNGGLFTASGLLRPVHRITAPLVPLIAPTCARRRFAVVVGDRLAIFTRARQHGGNECREQRADREAGREDICVGGIHGLTGDQKNVIFTKHAAIVRNRMPAQMSRNFIEGLRWFRWVVP